MQIPLKTLERIAQIYEKHGLNDSEKPSDAGKGYWQPTPFEVLNMETKSLFVQQYLGKLKHAGKALVAGAGDGRRALYLSQLGYDQVVGVELNPDLVASGNHIKELAAAQGLIDPKKITLVQGDFLDDRVYQKLGLHFSDFNFISAYLLKSNFEKLAGKFEEEAKKETVLYATQPVDFDFKDSKINLQEQVIGILQGNKYTHRSMHIYTLPNLATKR